MTDPGNQFQYDIRISVRVRYLAEQSDPAAQIYRHAYTVQITNTGTIGAQLISRHWIIQGESDQAQEVRGLGVVGHQPLLKPGQRFEYTSSSQIPSPTGRMQGSYFFVAEDGTRFDVPIPPFELNARTDGPEAARTPDTDPPAGRTLH